MRIITLRVIWLLCSRTLTTLEATIIGNAVSDCEATVGGCRYDGTLMEEVGRRLQCLDIDIDLRKCMRVPPLSRGRKLQTNRNEVEPRRCRKSLPQSSGHIFGFWARECMGLELKPCRRKRLLCGTSGGRPGGRNMPKTVYAS